MIIVLDTNCLWPDFSLQTETAQELAEYSARAESRLILPEVVFLETLACFEREATSFAGSVTKLERKLPRCLRGIVDLSNIKERAHQAQKALRREIEELTRKGTIVLAQISSNAARSAVNRAAQRIPPCSPKGEEVRDAMIWEITLESLRQYGGPVVIITSDKNFSENSLTEEIQRAGSQLFVFQSIQACLTHFQPGVDSPDSALAKRVLVSERCSDAIRRYIRDDPDYEFDSAIDNQLDLNDLIPGRFEVTRLVTAFLRCFRRPKLEAKENLHIIGEVQVELTVEAYSWVERPTKGIPVHVPTGEPRRIGLEFEGEAEILVPNCDEGEGPQVLYLYVKAGRHKGAEGWSVRVL